MSKISAVIISCNEASRIANCLKSIQAVADEIILVDCGSKDGTQEIAKSFGAKIFQQAWLGYGEQKNLGIDKASHNYILSIDCDETLDDELANAILEEKEIGLHGAYQFSRLNNYYGKFLTHGLEYPDNKIRLWDKNVCHWDNRLVHESLTIPPQTLVRRLKGNLLHFTFKSPSQHFAKLDRYSTESAKELYKKGIRNWRVKMITSPLFAFINGFILRLGFLDGYIGFVVAKMNAHYTYQKYAKLHKLLQKQSL